jgi:EmrB/QacA subfamily drug resistance transporter
VSGRQLTLAATVLGSSLAFIDASVVTIALPTIEHDLDLGLSGQQWVLLSYSLALAALYLVGGAVGDRRGRRETFVMGVAGFAAASLLAGIAPSGELLIVARALQGVAGAFLTVNSLALLREVYGDEAGRAIGLWTAFTSVATVAGPPAGGALVEWVSWRWIFFINLPLAALAVVLALAGRCPQREQQRVGRLDLPGAALAAIGFGALTYAMVEGADRGLTRYWWAFAVAAVSLAAFVVVERRTSEPMLPLGLFRRRNFTAANLETFLVYAALSGNSVFLTLYLQFLGFSPFEVSLIFIPVSVIMIAFASRFGSMADRLGPRFFLFAGPALLGIGTLLYLPVNERSDFWTTGMVGLVLFAFGLAMLVAPITAAALSSAPSAYAGIASGVNSTVSRLGGLLAVAVVGLVIARVFHASVEATSAVPLETGQVDPELRDASIDAFRVGMLVVAALAFAGAAVGAFGISNAEAASTRARDPGSDPSVSRAPPATLGTAPQAAPRDPSET